MANLLRSEARERAGLLAVHGYAVELDLTVGDELFRSVTRIRFDCTTPGAETFLDVRPAALRSVTLNGIALDVAGLADGRLPLADLAAENELVVDADMRYSRDGEGLHRAVDPVDGNGYVYASCEPDAAPRIIGCFDQPDLKAPYDVTVSVPTGWTVGGTGVPTADGPRWTLGTTPPLPTYLFSLIAGPYHAVRAEHDGIPLGLYCRASLADALEVQAAELFDLTGRCLDEYHRMFGVRYPFGAYDQAFVPEFTASGMEGPGCVTLGEWHLYRSAATGAQRLARARLIAHELAHQWFGDMVTMRWWDDLWLKEAFAEYAGYRVVAGATEFGEAWTALAIGLTASAYAADSSPASHPIATDAADVLAAQANFDAISYAKGAAALRQLAVWLGDEAFLAGVRSYVERHAYGNATLADLLAALEEVAGRDVGAWAAGWLRTAGVTTLTPQLSIGDGRIVAARLRQDPAPDGPLLPHRLAVGTYYPDGGRDLADVSINDAEADLPALIGRPAPSLVLVNDGNLTYARVRLDPHSAAHAPAMLPKMAQPLSRAVLYQALREAVDSAELSPAAYLDAVIAGLPTESFVATLDAVTEFARRVADRYLTEPAGARARAALAEALRTVAYAGDDRALAAFRHLVAVTADPAMLRGWLGETGTAAAEPGSGLPKGLALDIDLRWRLLQRLAVLGAVSPDEIDAVQAADPTTDGAHQALRVRASRADPAAKAMAWRSILHDGSLAASEIWALAAGFWQPEQVELTAVYVPRFFAEYPAAAADRNAWVVENLTQYLYPKYAVEPQTIALSEELMHLADLAPAVRRGIETGTAELRRALAARAMFAGR